VRDARGRERVDGGGDWIAKFIGLLQVLRHRLRFPRKSVHPPCALVGAIIAILVNVGGVDPRIAPSSMSGGRRPRRCSFSAGTSCVLGAICTWPFNNGPSWGPGS
jgi:hypothetical protein